MSMKAKHAFGALENIDSAISAGKIDAYDILFVKDANGKPYVGWIDKDGNKVVVDDSAEFAALESELLTKANAEEVEALEGQIATKADAAEVESLETELKTKANAEEVEEKLATKVDAETVQAMIEENSKAVVEVVEF